MSPIRIHLVLGLVWLLAGMLLGEHMGRTGDHGQMPTHAHIMLLGGVLPILWAVIYKVFDLAKGVLAWIQTVAHHIATAVMVAALYLLYGRMAAEAVLGPLLGISGIVIILATALMLFMGARAKV